LVTYIHKYTEQLTNDVSVYKSHFSPQYEFGHGLSYTAFEYSNMKLNKVSFSPDEEIIVSVNVRNTGKRSGKEAILLYTSDLYASITPDVKRLRRFAKVELQPGQEKLMTFTLTGKDLAFIGNDLNPVTEAGEFEVSIGNLKQKFTVTKTMVFKEQHSLPVL
jgi:beta-glucosidase